MVELEAVMRKSTLSVLLLLGVGCDDKSSEAEAPVVDTGSACLSGEIPYDGLDNDCDPLTPDDDLDGDGLLQAEDCNDNDATQGGEEVAYDGLDNDCDPLTPDDDLDGDGALYSLDCDDGDAARTPGADEVCDNIDNDCDDEVDEDAVDAQSFYADADGDGYGDPNEVLADCTIPSGYTEDSADCDDGNEFISPAEAEVCNRADDDCDGDLDEDLTCLSFGGHRVENDGSFYYALYNDDGFGVIGTSEWYGSSDNSSSPEGVTWNEDYSALYYNDIYGNVFVQVEPFGASSTLIGSFSLGQVGGGVVYDGYYYVGDYSNGDIYQMDIATGAVSLYSSLDSACKPYFGNSAMAIDIDGSIYAASSCGIVRYEAWKSAAEINNYTNLLSAVAMNADQDLYSIDQSGNLVEFDKSTGATLSSVSLAHTPSTTWTMAFDSAGDVLVNFWGEQRLFSSTAGSVLESWSASAYYPGTSGYYWYVTF